MTRTLSVLAGASLLALAGAANAGEPVALTSTQMDRQLTGNLAFAEADATAYGSDTIAQSLTATYSDPYMSAATSTSVSGSN